MNRILLGVAALSLVGVYEASADVLVMEDGRRIRGELVSVNRGQVIFDEVREGSTSKRRMRLNKDEVARIVLREDRRDPGDADMEETDDDDGPFGPSRDDDRVDDGPFGRTRDRDRDADRDRGTGDRFPRDRDRDADDPLGRDRGAERSTDRPGLGDDRGLSSRDRMVSVPARQAWTDTGIDVKTGDVVRFSAEGAVLWGPGRKTAPRAR